MSAKITELTTKTYAQLSNASTALIPIVDDASNFSITVAEMLATASNLGGGTKIYKDQIGKELQFKSLTNDDTKLTITNTDTEVDFGVNESNLILSNMVGPLSLSKGGLGVALSDPNKDQLLFWNDTTDQMEWMDISNKISLSAGQLSVNESNIDLANCDNSAALFQVSGTSGLTSADYVTGASPFEVGISSAEADVAATHRIELAIDGTVYKLLATL